MINCALEPTFFRHSAHESGEFSMSLPKCWLIENRKIENRKELFWQRHHNYLRTNWSDHCVYYSEIEFSLSLFLFISWTASDKLMLINFFIFYFLTHVCHQLSQKGKEEGGEEVHFLEKISFELRRLSPCHLIAF